MRAVIAQDKQPVIVELPTPTPGPNELLIRVSGAALNRADLMQVQGNYPPPPGAPDTLGMELAGEVIGMGADVQRFEIGQRVMSLVAGGGYAEEALAPADHTMPVPDHFSDAEAAATPEAFLTAYRNMVMIGGLTSGEIVLIHAGASGVGLAAIQIAKALGTTVIVTASAGKHDTCREHGADMVIDYKSENFADRILSEHSGVDLVVELVGAPYWDDNVRVLNLWGRLVFIGLQGGGKKEIDFRDIMRKRIGVMGSTLRDETDSGKAALVGVFWMWAAPLFKSGFLRPTVWKTLPLDQVAEAHDLMRQNVSAGKIVLTMN